MKYYLYSREKVIEMLAVVAKTATEPRGYMYAIELLSKAYGEEKEVVPASVQPDAEAA